jgi:hypothetical protein
VTFEHTELFLYARFGKGTVNWSLSETRKMLHVFSAEYAAGIEIWLDRQQVRLIKASDRAEVQLDLHAPTLGAVLRVYLRGESVGPSNWSGTLAAHPEMHRSGTA